MSSCELRVALLQAQVQGEGAERYQVWPAAVGAVMVVSAVAVAMVVITVIVNALAVSAAVLSAGIVTALSAVVTDW